MPFTHPDAWCLVTYTAADSTTVQAWNPRDGVVPAVITVPGTGKPAARTGAVFKGEGYTPPGGTLTFTSVPPPPPPVPGKQTAYQLGWPGQPWTAGG